MGNLKYTLAKCKEDMIELWGFLATTGEDSKDSHPNKAKFSKLISRCPCCEYDAQFPEALCCHCPCWIGWDGCFSFKGEYRLWVNAPTKVLRQYWANKILIRSLMIRVGVE
jgi:hypothetical protein